MRFRTFTAQAVMAGALAFAGCQSGDKPQVPQTEAPAPLPAQEQPQATASPALGNAPSSGIVEPLKPPPLSATTTSVRDPQGALSVAELRWLKLHIDVLGAPQNSELALELVAPGGLAYERRTAKLSGTPFDTQGADFDLAVAGTLIERGRMTGAWTANYYLDGQPLASESFDVNP